MAVPSSQLEQIKSNLDIIQVIGEVVPLQKKGNNYFGCCPFHAEKTASFSVSGERQLFHCFGCKAGGDLFKFVQLYHRYDFRQAVEELAKRAGVSLSQSDRSGDWDESLAILEKTAEFFEEQLWSSKAKAFQDYLKTRGIPKSVAKDFRLGAHLGGSQEVLSFLKRAQLSRDIASKLGIVGRKPPSDWSDRWRGRLIFPIADERGRIRGFGARSLGNEQPKYINSPASALFDKKKLLYGMSLASDLIRKRDYVILVEGYMDVIALHREGIRNAVGSMGTALTADQIRKLKRWTHRLLSLFDGDEAGLKATERSLDLYIREAVNAKVLILPGGAKDPDSFFESLRLKGEDRLKAWRQALKGAQPALDFLIQHRVLSETDSVLRAKRLRDLVELLDRSPDPLQRTALKREISSRFKIPWEMLENRPPEAPFKPSGGFREQDHGRNAQEPPIYREALKFMILWGNDLELQATEILSFVEDQGPWSKLLRKLLAEGEDISSLKWLETESEEMQAEVREWLIEERTKDSDQESLDFVWTQIRKRLKSEFIKREGMRLQTALESAEAANDVKTVKAILREKQDLVRLLDESSVV
ncbi:MAG: DNA primase [Bradymonadales bacterium]|nr:MAG: DNA primase [Bradymonadales bacterium]